ncbi:hypothetical protein JQX09_12855 [Sulfitobacter pseudonitzschiae]|uniref:Uncharacterized protein n=1 Tax=Pseudosulfitobacter pseudonitzschiae TaxID=1402135 RepID=A0A9Q2S0Q8_9RHOB|nr:MULTISPECIES: hypothetical protein [Roseobacteraceae]MBM2292988.1 hypothetical protein [Pseudosulfitobacter pseudonitzschiae]MBM2297724.1 hypothetical protein [Pseudosulfitobacter pseudonitzschiae]MBM2302638.1 hypothetical protein [Pseudosulfitobacter pseudonitzschiae]MBM2312372.1 hypothetical protein [Pseudosulfitobacter pseudonitzschiae]MBM2317334.1 hypothetical protein [Pseudosulfitobacter pseudonitzschiae]|tara:strand:+ start:2711 stop:3106 length:396 start_codon:yes stop_codon:yes gene_type:complete
MTEITENEDAHEFRSEAVSLWRITFGPLIWAVHFAACYGATALVCAKGGAVDGLRLGIGIGTVVALVAIVWLGWQAWRQWDLVRDRDWENDQGTGEDRHQFLGHAAFLLTVISFIGVSYVALPALLIGTCR